MQVFIPIQGRYLLQVGINGYTNPFGRCQDCPRRSDDRVVMITVPNNCDRFDHPYDSYFIFCLRTFGTRCERYNYLHYLIVDVRIYPRYRAEVTCRFNRLAPHLYILALGCMVRG